MVKPTKKYTPAAHSGRQSNTGIQGDSNLPSSSVDRSGPPASSRVRPISTESRSERFTTYVPLTNLSEPSHTQGVNSSYTMQPAYSSVNQQHHNARGATVYAPVQTGNLPMTAPLISSYPPMQNFATVPPFQPQGRPQVLLSQNQSWTPQSHGVTVQYHPSQPMQAPSYVAPYPTPTGPQFALPATLTFSTFGSNSQQQIMPQQQMMPQQLGPVGLNPNQPPLYHQPALHSDYPGQPASQTSTSQNITPTNTNTDLEALQAAQAQLITTLVVKNLPRHTRDDMLFVRFSQHGKVREIRQPRERETYRFVEYRIREDAERARLAENKTLLMNNIISVEFATKLPTIKKGSRPHKTTTEAGTQIHDRHGNRNMIAHSHTNPRQSRQPRPIGEIDTSTNPLLPSTMARSPPTFPLPTQQEPRQFVPQQQPAAAPQQTTTGWHSLLNDTKDGWEQFVLNNIPSAQYPNQFTQGQGFWNRRPALNKLIW